MRQQCNSLACLTLKPTVPDTFSLVVFTDISSRIFVLSPFRLIVLKDASWRAAGISRSRHGQHGCAVPWFCRPGKTDGTGVSQGQQGIHYHKTRQRLVGGQQRKDKTGSWNADEESKNDSANETHKRGSVHDTARPARERKKMQKKAAFQSKIPRTRGNSQENKNLLK